MQFVSAYIHLVAAVFLTGYVLFWAIMVISLRRHGDGERAPALLALVNRSRWPHVVVPWKLRLPLPIVGWAIIAVLIVSGLVLLAAGPAELGGVMIAKLAVVLAIVGLQVPLTRRPHHGLILANFLAVLAVIVVSALILR